MAERMPEHRQIVARVVGRSRRKLNVVLPPDGETDMSATELIGRIEKHVAWLRAEFHKRPQNPANPDGMTWVDATFSEWQALLRLARIGQLAEHYVDIRTNHPQAAGEMWRELCAEIEREV